jgi:hypothetical protein
MFPFKYPLKMIPIQFGKPVGRIMNNEHILRTRASMYNTAPAAVACPEMKRNAK